MTSSFMNERNFTNVDRVLPVFEYLSDNKNINIGPVFPFLVLEWENNINFALINMIHVKTYKHGANITSNTPTKRPKVPFTPACLNKEKLLRQIEFIL